MGKAEWHPKTLPPRPSPLDRHPELGSGSISRLYPSVYVARWMLKRVQHDVGGNAPLRPPRLCVNPLICHSRESGNLWAELSPKWFAQRHEGIKRLLRVFVSSCEPKSYRVRKYKTMGSRFRGNDNVGALGCVNGYARRPELVSGSISPLVPSGSVARWMLNRVQHDIVGNASLRPLRLCVNPFCRDFCDSAQIHNHRSKSLAKCITRTISIRSSNTK